MSTMVFTEQGNTMNDHKNVVMSDLDTNLVLIENRLNKRCMMQQMILQQFGTEVTQKEQTTYLATCYFSGSNMALKFTSQEKHGNEVSH